MQCIINHIRLLLWDRDPRSYSYYVEVLLHTVTVVSLCPDWSIQTTPTTRALLDVR